MRHPNRGQSKDVGENIVGQAPAQVRQHRNVLAAGRCHRANRPLRPGMGRVKTRRVHCDTPSDEFDRLESTSIQVAS